MQLPELKGLMTSGNPFYNPGLMVHWTLRYHSVPHPKAVYPQLTFLIACLASPSPTGQLHWAESVPELEKKIQSIIRHTPSCCNTPLEMAHLRDLHTLPENGRSTLSAMLIYQFNSEMHTCTKRFPLWDYKPLNNNMPTMHTPQNKLIVPVSKNAQ